MNIGAIILCRFDSSRLYGKALKRICEKPIIEWIYYFLRKSDKINNIYIATSNHESDNAIAEFCYGKEIEVFRGSKDNVAKRFLDCAEFYELDYAFRINGDNLFVNSEILSLSEKQKIIQIIISLGSNKT